MDLDNDIFASPEGGKHSFRDPIKKKTHEVMTRPLGAALARATAGQTIHLARGVYRHPQKLSFRANGRQPTRIIGQPGVLLDPGLAPATTIQGHMTPTEDDFAFFNIQNSSHLHLYGLNFANCWPTFIFMRNCQDILIKEVSGIGSQFAVFARTGRHGAGKDQETAGIRLVKIDWTQDPTGEMASGRVGWSDIKTFRSHSYFNGALFGSWDIAGEVEITKCIVKDAFNGVRMDCHPKNKQQVNSNVWIHNNRFRRVRDNAIEPETKAQNWWVHDNHFENCHAPFSLHNLSGGWIYIFANEFRFDSKIPGDDHTGGKVFKFSGSKPFPTAPIYAFHNSAFIRTPYAKKGRTKHWKHFNNAIEFDFSPNLSDPYVGFFSTSRDKDNIPNIKTRPGKHFIWHDSYEFNGDVSNHAQFPDEFPEEWGVKTRGQRRDQVFGHKSRYGLYLDGPPETWPTGEQFEVFLPDGTRLTLGKDAIVGSRDASGRRFADAKLKYRIYRVNEIGPWPPKTS